jgi:hypothetical protein
MKRRFMILALVAACSDGGALPDARVDGANIDGASLDAPSVDAGTVTCSCCTQRHFDAEMAFDVASAGDLYVTFIPSTGAPTALGIVPPSGGPPTTIATAEQFVLATFDTALFYAARTGTSYELRQRVGTDDTMLGTVTSLDRIGIAANATDLYVLGVESAGTRTLRRFPRTGGASEIITTVTSNVVPHVALGTTYALFGHRWTVPLSANSTATELPPYPDLAQVVVSGDLAFVLGVDMQTSNTRICWVDRILPSSMRLAGPSTIHLGGFSELTADTNRLYWRVQSGSLQPGSTTTQQLTASNLDGTARSTVCNSWPSTIVRQDATHLFGLAQASVDWVVDVVPKP